ncbi:hypothetical protein RFI_14009 [Reticulomyxa filosa]|uniref:Uncharacterized protein n=1 Tax=Reticulomyxa filosa TaxID=46433 RepID=X6NBL8_RETFI|nr:hypothetical protein RFI_14009 [Reticulomyxa filosa]|eukprot:ETO23174.1 hypothetical protein RFI_14009 [Reticulomyxa filosa]
MNLWTEWFLLERYMPHWLFWTCVKFYCNLDFNIYSKGVTDAMKTAMTAFLRDNCAPDAANIQPLDLDFNDPNAISVNRFCTKDLTLPYRATRTFHDDIVTNLWLAFLASNPRTFSLDQNLRHYCVLSAELFVLEFCVPGTTHLKIPSFFQTQITGKHETIWRFWKKHCKPKSKKEDGGDTEEKKDGSSIKTTLEGADEKEDADMEFLRQRTLLIASFSDRINKELLNRKRTLRTLKQQKKEFVGTFLPPTKEVVNEKAAEPLEVKTSAQDTVTDQSEQQLPNQNEVAPTKESGNNDWESLRFEDIVVPLTVKENVNVSNENIDDMNLEWDFTQPSNNKVHEKKTADNHNFELRNSENLKKLDLNNVELELDLSNFTF